MSQIKNPELYRAALVIIGNEILSGRTQDTNSRHIAAKLVERGIMMAEIRVVADIEEDIIEAVNALRGKVDYVFTTGGIGPTHDDITAESVAKAFETPLERNEEALAMMNVHYQKRGVAMTDARAKMAMIPKGATLIPNPVSGAPGFIIGNVHVMAGVPNIMEVMLDHVVAGLKEGAKIRSVSVEAQFPESVIAGPLAELQEKYPDVEMGSYPKLENEKWGAALVLRSTNEAALKKAEQELQGIVQSLSG